MLKRGLWVVVISAIVSLAVTTAAFATYYKLNKPVPAQVDIYAANVLSPDNLKIYLDEGCTQELTAFQFSVPAGFTDGVDCYLKNDSPVNLYVVTDDDFGYGAVYLRELAHDEALAPGAVRRVNVELYVSDWAPEGQRSFNITFKALSQPWSTPLPHTVTVTLAQTTTQTVTRYITITQTVGGSTTTVTATETFTTCPPSPTPQST